MAPDVFLRLANLLPDALLLVSVDGTILAANRAAHALLGREVGALHECRLDAVFDSPPHDVERFLRSSARTRVLFIGAMTFSAASGPILFRCEGALVSPSGERESANVMVRLVNKEEAVRGFTMLNSTIEELNVEVERRKQTEESLREQVHLMSFGRKIGLTLAQPDDLDKTLQSCAEIMVNDLDGALARIWSLGPDDTQLVLRASAGMYTHLDGGHSRIPLGELKIGGIAQSQQPHLTNSVVSDPHIDDQEWAEEQGIVSFAGYPLIVDDRTVGVMAVFARHPMSDWLLEVMASVAHELALGMERKRAEALIQKQAAALQAADQRKDEFLAMLAHELRNPLAPIRSGLDLLKIEGVGHDTIELMQQQVQHLVRLVDDLLDVSRIMRGRIQLQKEPVPLGVILRRAIDTCRPMVTSRRHALEVVTDDDDCWLLADAVRITQVVTNLLTNAVKYTPPGGTITLSTQTVADDKVLISIRDDGIGIDTDFLPVIFQLFSQASRTLDRAAGGLGVGLSVVQRLVRMHQGTVTAHSDGPGTGSEFTIRLPAFKPPAVHPGLGTENHAADAPNSTGSYRILVVDDTVASAKILERILCSYGDHKVQLAHDGRSACTIAGAFAPDIVLLDIGLPEMDGYQVARRLRELPRLANTKIVAVTGYGADSDRRESAAAGIDMHLVKPISVEDLSRVLESMPQPSA